MLEINNITKIYETDGFKQKALNKVSVKFRDNEFASILGPSGSGKTTLLNIIGGLDHYTEGDLIINGVSTKKYKDKDWDSYRNHRIGFVFQNYNLITHQTILKNVELALTLSGIPRKERRKRAKEALIEVGLKDHINKKPNQLSGGQMQRVAIARALVNNPEILLADEPTGALDSETSVQIMNLLKEIGSKKLVIMVTHNPDLANEYSTRIIELKDGNIIKDSKPVRNTKEKQEDNELTKNKTKKTNMSYFTALGLSFNNLMTKKKRTILVSLAGSIGIIGIALILSLSTGFQNYIDKLQEDTLSSYPLTITNESMDVTSMLLSMTSGEQDNEEESNVIKEQQYITSMLKSISTNDLKSFNRYLKKNYSKVEKDITSIKYSYSIDPIIYTYDKTNTLAKLNPSNLFTSIYGSSSLSSYSSLASTYSQMINDQEKLDEQYDVLEGKWPTSYDEMVVVLSSPNQISDLLVYSLGLRDTSELTKMIEDVMTGEGTDINNEPLEITYEDLLNLDLRLIKPTDLYKYNSKYKIYEDMSEDESYMKELYKNATKLKIVGVVCAKEGVSTLSLNPGVAYTEDLIDYIIDYSSKTDIVKKQLENEDIDVFSNKSFDDKNSSLDLDFSNLITVDSDMLSKAFGINIDQDEIASKTSNYMSEIESSITVDSTKAYDSFIKVLKELEKGLVFTNLTEDNMDSIIDNYLENNISKLEDLESNYVLPSDTFKTTYKGLLKSILQVYLSSYNAYIGSLPETNTVYDSNYNEEILNTVIEGFNSNQVVIGTAETMAKYMTEAKMKKDILTKVGSLTQELSSSFANAFNVDEEKIASAFKFNMTEDQLSRIMSAMTCSNSSNQTSNLISLGYQDKEEPTSISFYFSSFDAKEDFIDFIDDYNDKQEEEQKLRYSDTTGILMGSVKKIVNSVSYVLIAFVSISLVVSSIMIGIITYISVYERTKEIGILRAIGASKRNISTIFNAETFIIGLLAGLLGMAITYSLIPIINNLIHSLTGNNDISALLEISNAIKLVLLSIILTIISGLIPSKSASNKDPVESLRCE